MVVRSGSDSDTGVGVGVGAEGLGEVISGASFLLAGLLRVCFTFCFGKCFTFCFVRLKHLLRVCFTVA